MNQTKTKISDQVQAIQHFIEKMDIEMIDTFLDSEKTYQDFKKYLFVSKLQQAFEEFEFLGDTHLFSVEGNCNGCDKTKIGFSFIGNYSKNYMNIIFDAEDGKINDLYECRNFRKLPSDLSLERRIYIDKNLVNNF